MSVTDQRGSLGLTMRETQRELRISETTLRQAIKNGEIHAIRIGRRVIIPRASLERLLGGSK